MLSIKVESAKISCFNIAFVGKPEGDWLNPPFSMGRVKTKRLRSGIRV